MTALPQFADDIEALPEGAWVDGRHASAASTAIADFVVIGSGASGAVAAATLTAAGHDVVILEEGPWIRTRTMQPSLAHGMRTLFRGGGAQVTFGRSNLILMQGSNVGGTTTVNSAIALRASDELLETWDRDHRLAGTLGPRALEPHFEALEKALKVRPVAAAVLGEQNRLFGEAARRLGVVAEPVPRFESGCVGSAGCLTGCREGKKLGMGVTFIPDALRAGARLYSSARVERIVSHEGRATGVVARFKSGAAPTLTVLARKGVVVCASAVQTPNLLRRSSVRSPALGQYFQVHPGVSIGGRFDRPIRQEFGATQGFNSMHFAKSHRFKLESVSLQPELMAMNIAGAGHTLTRHLENFDHLMAWAVALRGEANGSVKGFLGGDQVFYTPTRLDMERIRTGLKVLTQMMFEVGALEVWPGVHGMPASLRSADELHRWDDASLDPRAYNLIATHLFGAARIGPEPKGSVIGLDFQAHELERLWVLDSSLFPSNLGTNPQLTIMAIARLGAQQISSDAKGRLR